MNRLRATSNGDTLRLVWTLTWPLTITYFLISTIGLTDMYLAARLGDEAQAAVGLGDQVLFFTVALGTGLAAGISALVARSTGSSELKMVRTYGLCGLVVCFVFGLLAVLGGWLAGPFVCALLTNSESERALSQSYVQSCAPANLPFILAMGLAAISRGEGKPIHTVQIWLVITSLTIAASFLFFFYEPSLPSLGWAWDLGAAVGAVYGLTQRCRSSCAALHRSAHAVSTSTAWKGYWRCATEILLIGLPATATEVLSIGSSFLVFSILARTNNGATLQASWAIFLKVEETCAIVPLMAVALAIGVIVGQKLGVGRTDDARRVTTVTNRTVAAVMLLVGTSVAFASPLVAAAFSPDRAVMQATRELLLATPLFFPLLSLRFVFLGAMEGAGATSFPLLCELVGNLCALATAAILLLLFPIGTTGLILSTLFGRITKAGLSKYCFQAANWIH